MTAVAFNLKRDKVDSNSFVIRETPVHTLPLPADAFTVRSEKAAAVFADQRRHLVFELARGARALKELADATGMSLPLLTYHVRRLVALGLVREQRKAPHAGKHVRRYRAVAAAFFVPAALAPPPDEHLSAELSAALAEARQGDADGGVCYFLDQGRPVMRRVAARKGPPALDLWRMAMLSEADARDLAAELEKLLARFGGGTRGKPYLIRAALAPRSLAGPRPDG